MVFRRTIKSRKRRTLKKRSRKQRGGNGNNVAAKNIYRLMNLDNSEKLETFSRLKSALEKRLKEGKENWLIIFAKFGNGQEKARFHDENWVYLDESEQDHELHDKPDVRILIKLNFNKKDDVDMLFTYCPNLFSYISFDGEWGTKNISEESIPTYLKGLTQNGVVATSYRYSSIYNSANESLYALKITNIPTQSVPLARGTNPGPLLNKFRYLIYYIGEALRVNADISYIPQFYNFPISRICESKISNYTLPISSTDPCRNKYDELMTKYNGMLKTLGENMVDNIINMHTKICLTKIWEKFKIPNFDSANTISESEINQYQVEDLTVLVKKL